MLAKTRNSPHPGEILAEEFMKPLGLSDNGLAMALRVPANRITGIVNGERAVTADTALRLARYFGSTAEFWINLQAGHDLSKARAETGSQIAVEVRVARAPKAAAGKMMKVGTLERYEIKERRHAEAIRNKRTEADYPDTMMTRVKHALKSGRKMHTDDGWFVDSETGELIGPDLGGRHRHENKR
jgi:addiction module HigA family antidote